MSKPQATSDYSVDRGLPASIEAERAILGAILLDNSCINQALESIRVDDFSLDSHRRIYQRMCELQEAGNAIDFVTITECLAQHKEVDAVGGVIYVTSLTDGLPRVKNIEQYCKILRDKAILRAVIHSHSAIVQRAYDQSETPSELLDSATTELFEITDRSIDNQGLRTIPQIVAGSFGSIDQLYEQGQRITGLETHYIDFDNMTSGLQPKELIIVAARPSVGKSSLAINIAENVAIKDQKKVAFFSLEMSKESQLLRLLSSVARVDSMKMRSGFLGHDDYHKLVNALAQLVDAPILIDDTPGLSISEMRAKCRRMQQAMGLDLIIVDYLQLMTAPVKKNDNRTQEVSAVSRGLKATAKELGVPVLALAQLNRSPEQRTGTGRRPQLSDLRESGQIELDSDVVAFIFREEMYEPDNPELEGKAELIIGKNRSGPTGVVRLAFLKRLTRFENLMTDDTSSSYGV